MEDENFDDLSIADWFAIGRITMIYKADVSDFKEGEIWSLSPKVPFTIKERNTWDGQLSKNPPIVGNYGIDKDRKVFIFLPNKTWRSLK